MAQINVSGPDLWHQYSYRQPHPLPSANTFSDGRLLFSWSATRCGAGLWNVSGIRDLNVDFPVTNKPLRDRKLLLSHALVITSFRASHIAPSDTAGNPRPCGKVAQHRRVAAPCASLSARDYKSNKAILAARRLFSLNIGFSAGSTIAA